MKFEDFKEYIEICKNNPKFDEVVDFTKMTQIRKDKDFYENIKYYLSLYLPKTDIKSSFEPDYDKLIKFLHLCINNKPIEIFKDEKGFIDLDKTLHVIKPPRYCEYKGNCLDSHVMLADGTKFICKKPLSYRGNSGAYNKNCIFSAFIASNIARNVGVEAAEISLAYKNKEQKILSKNFLKENEKFVSVLDDVEEQPISVQLSCIEQYMRDNKCSQTEIDKTKFDFIKQEFVSKLIGLKDQTSNNTPLIESINSEGEKHIKLSPMFDLDYSFHIGEGNEDLKIRKCDNGKDDIESLIFEFKDFPGFREFATNCVKNLNMEKILKNIYDETGIVYFKDYANNNDISEFIEFVNKNISLANSAINKVYKSERDER